ncbi:hypothetical protein, partial [Escherichia coli]|uniref:hypothetical protein n=1 Tax=Escherichia coli TaxID=562 RepID=UPI001EDC7015
VWYQPGNSPAVQSDEAVPAYADISSRHICRIQAVSKAFSLKRGATVIHRFWGSLRKEYVPGKSAPGKKTAGGAAAGYES